MSLPSTAFFNYYFYTHIIIVTSCWDQVVEFWETLLTPQMSLYYKSEFLFRNRAHTSVGVCCACTLCVCVCVFAMSIVSCIVGMNVRSGVCKLAIMLRIVHSKSYKDFLQIFLKRRVMCKDHVYNYFKSTGYKKLTDFLLKFFAVVR